MNLDTSAASPRILLVSNDDVLAQHMSLDLSESGYETAIATNTDSTLMQIQDFAPDLIVIDRMLTGESGIVLCNHLRQTGLRSPLLLLMSRDSVSDRVACLEAGADDYFLKPYRTDDFLRLVNFYLQPSAQAGEELRFADLVLDLGNRRVIRGDRTIELTVKEFELLKYLMEHPREVMTREQILENVWGYDFMGESNVIEVYVRYLRLKIEEEGEKRLIQTVRGVGYVLREN